MRPTTPCAYHRDPVEGRKIAVKVLATLPSCPAPKIARLGRTLKRWREALLAHFTNGRSNNGGTEAINGLLELRRRVSVNRPSPMGNRRSCEVPGPAAGEVDTDGRRVFEEERRWDFMWRRGPRGTDWSGRAAMSSWSTGSWLTSVSATSRRRRDGRMPLTC